MKIKKVDQSLPLPERKTKGAVGYDLTSRVDVSILPREIGYVPLNIIVKIPKGYGLFVLARSGTHKKGLMLANGVGLIDPDFCGEEDEIVAAYYNFSDRPVNIEKGERIAQCVVKKCEKVEWKEVKKMDSKSRGKFGSTGNK